MSMNVQHYKLAFFLFCPCLIFKSLFLKIKRKLLSNLVTNSGRWAPH